MTGEEGGAGVDGFCTDEDPFGLDAGVGVGQVAESTEGVEAF